MSPLTDRIRRDLLDWFSEQRRPLPWRETKDPYAIWLSEIMLQQTTVRAVEPRWRRFLERFPSVKALADASVDDVLAEWSGLGYYARARHLHAAAKMTIRDFGGRLPERFELLLALPGMGRYTAAAVASIAFGEAIAAVDANVERVVARLDAMEEDARSSRGRQKVEQRARELLDPARPGIWNEAMMELGALVCLARAPQCSVCPVADHCAARKTGRPEDFPVLRPKTPMKDVREAAIIVQKEGKILVMKRPPEGSFADMWEIPRSEVAKGEGAKSAAARVLQELTSLQARPRGPVLRLQHVVMRSRIQLHVFTTEHPGGRVRRKFHVAHEWISPSEWMKRPISTTQKDIAQFLAEGKVPRRQAPKPKIASDQPELFDESGEST
ncbi:A/G-specific adenine glycosylase [bacterium]|nr:A/G-specific adenine glycosylase [bacterium]